MSRVRHQRQHASISSASILVGVVHARLLSALLRAILAEHLRRSEISLQRTELPRLSRSTRRHIEHRVLRLHEPITDIHDEFLELSTHSRLPLPRASAQRSIRNQCGGIDRPSDGVGSDLKDELFEHDHLS